MTTDMRTYTAAVSEVFSDSSVQDGIARIRRRFAELADRIIQDLPDGPQRTEALATHLPRAREACEQAIFDGLRRFL